MGWSKTSVWVRNVVSWCFIGTNIQPPYCREYTWACGGFAGGLCELSVWLLITQNGCKIETFSSYVVCITQLTGESDTQLHANTKSTLAHDNVCVHVCAGQNVSESLLFFTLGDIQQAEKNFETDPNQMEKVENCCFLLNKFSYDGKHISQPAIKAH